MNKVAVVKVNNYYHVKKDIQKLFDLLELPLDNPLGYLIKPGMTVVIKPNFVSHRNLSGDSIWAVVTHPSIIQVMVEYCWQALQGKGEVIIADAPQYDCDWDKLMQIEKLDNVNAEILDLRPYWSKEKHFKSMKKYLDGDPKGAAICLIKGKINKKNIKKLYGASYNRKETMAHHSLQYGSSYLISKTIMDADVIISIPKMKTHKKVGVSLNAKNLVGTVVNKNCLSHYTLGSPNKGGDQYPDDLFTSMELNLIDLERWMYDNLLANGNICLEYLHRFIYWLHNHTLRKLGIKVNENKRLFDAGNWHGNDTCWRMVADLMEIFKNKKMFSIIDGIIGGDGNGPLAPNEVPSGLLLAGDNLLNVDLTAIWMMGFDMSKIPFYKISNPLYDVVYNFDIDSCIKFKPHLGWKGYIEL